MNFKHKFVFLLPGLIVLIGILIFPIIFTVRLSLSGWNSFNPELDFVGIKNYIRLFTDDPRFWQSFFRLSFLAITTVFLQYIIGFALAHMVWKDIKFKRFFRVLFLIWFKFTRSHQLIFYILFKLIYFIFSKIKLVFFIL